MDEDTLLAAAKAAAGNWQEFPSFGWGTRPADADSMYLAGIEHRDSEILEQSNAQAIKAILEPFTTPLENDDDGEGGVLDPDVCYWRARHWGVGWVEHIQIRVFDREGNVTAAFRAWVEIQGQLEQYTVLDEQDYCERELEVEKEACETAIDDWRRHCSLYSEVQDAACELGRAASDCIRYYLCQVEDDDRSLMQFVSEQFCYQVRETPSRMIEVALTERWEANVQASLAKAYEDEVKAGVWRPMQWYDSARPVADNIEAFWGCAAWQRVEAEAKKKSGSST